MIVLIDSREQQPFSFNDSIFCKGSEITTLKTGDYTVKGCESILSIERKKSAMELASNITQDRFVRELERLKPFKYKFVLCEFDYNDIILYPHNQPLPKHIKAKIKVSGSFIIKKISEFTIDYGISFIMAGSKELANRICIDLMKRVYATFNS